LRRKKGFTPEQAATLASSAGGSIGRALEMSGEDDLRIRNTVLEALAGALRDRAAPPTSTLLAALGKEREEVVRRLEMVRLCLRDVLVWKETGSRDLLHYGDRLDLIGPLAESFSGRELIARLKSVDNTLRAVEQNANRPLALEAMLLSGSRAA
jgi:hypothetical protein